MRQKLESLDCIVKQGQGGKACVVLFHGYGANCEDLAPLADVVRGGDDITWVFPDGLIEIPIGPHMMGRAWFPIDVEALEQAMQTGTHRDLSGSRPEGLDEAAERAMELIESLQVDYEKVLIGGFSQGSMLSLECATKLPQKPDGLILMSSSPLNFEEWKRDLPGCQRMPFFQSHGQMDPLLSYQGALQLEAELKKAGLEGDMISFPGGHEIPPPVLMALSDFVAMHVG
jgi:phospholipase/carboxylesterase